MRILAGRLTDSLALKLHSIEKTPAHLQEDTKKNRAIAFVCALCQIVLKNTHKKKLKSQF